MMIRNSLIFTLLFLTVLSTTLTAQTNVSGGIYNNTTWSLAGSPYIVTSDIVVFPQRTLTIEPGVEVRVQGNGYPNTMGTYIEIRGQLVALGTANAPITFKADGPVTGTYSWRGIYIKTSQGGDADLAYFNMHNAYNGISSDGVVIGTDTLRLRECNFFDNVTGISPFSPVEFRNCNFVRNSNAVQPAAWTSFEAYNCTFDSNIVVLPYVYGEVTVDSCTFTHNDFVFASTNIGSITNSLFDQNDVVFNTGGFNIYNCQLTNNRLALNQWISGSATNCVIRNNVLGVELAAGASLINNEISNNQTGIRLWSTPTAFTGNRICGNTLYNVENGADLNLSLVGNCFCESDSTVIENLLMDGYDDITKGLFNYAIYDSTCVNIVQLVSKVILTGIAQGTDAGSLQVYPNPVNDRLQVTLPEGVDQGMISLLNLQGQEVVRLIAEGQTTIEMGGLTPGIYFLKFFGATGQSVVKVLKQ